MSEKTEQIKTNVVFTLESHFEYFGIDEGTGLSKYKLKEKALRFSEYPHIGEKYADQKVRVVIVGADLGSDELKDINNGKGSYHTFETKTNRLPEYNKTNAHMAGTYAIVIYLLRDSFPDLYSIIYPKDFTNSGLTARRAIRKLYGISAKELISSFAMTNLHKFVTKNRPVKSGDENRRWFDQNAEFEFFKDELIALEPTVVVFQEPKVGKLNDAQIEELRNTLKGCTIVRLLHPSTRKKGGYQLYEDIVKKINGPSHDKP